MTKKLTFCLVLVLILFSCGSVKADVVILESGKVITGKVLQQDTDGVLIQMDYGTFRYPLSMIKDVKKTALASPSEASSGQRIPNWARIISSLATNEWAHELKQIPATVIDSGELKDVPYVSFRCNSGGYEINIYGDLDHPAGVEIGAVNYLVKNDEAKRNCVNFISSVLANANDQAIVGALNLTQKDSTKRDGLTFETTLPDEPDAYGGWWVSVYDEDSLTKARVSGAELLAITQPRAEPPPRRDVAIAQPATPETTDWTASDLSYSRSGTSGSSSGGGQVYVRGYYRSNGTYVHSYTRSYPHSR
jgi:hypothetical protein